MDYYLKCPVKDCIFFRTIDVNASKAECIEIYSQFKRHLTTHRVDELTDTIFRLVMALEEKPFK